MLEKDIKEHFEYIFEGNMEKMLEFSSNNLIFSFLMGMSPSECEGMDIEPEFTADQEREYYEVEGIINRLKRSIKN